MNIYRMLTVEDGKAVKHELYHRDDVNPKLALMDEMAALLNECADILDAEYRDTVLIRETLARYEDMK
jgi:Mor family transcriptional regulator